MNYKQLIELKKTLTEFRFEDKEQQKPRLSISRALDIIDIEIARNRLRSKHYRDDMIPEIWS